MILSRLSPVLCLVALLPIVASSRPSSQEAVDLERVLRERSAQAESLSREELWLEVSRRNLLVEQGDQESLDALLDRLLRDPKGVEGIGPRGLLLWVGLRAAGPDPDWKLLAPLVAPLLDSPDPEVVLAAAETFTAVEPKLLREIATDTLIKLRQTLTAISEDGDRAPELRVEAAVAAVPLGEGKPRKVLEGFLRSTDPDLHELGVLGMARVGLSEAVEAELVKLTSAPGRVGVLARALEDQLEVRRIMQRRVDIALSNGPEVAPLNGLPSELDRVEKVVEVVRQLHLEGDLHTRDELIDAALDGMLQSLDQHSSYFSPEEYKKFEQELEAEYGGIGAYVGTDPGDGIFTITRPIYSGPAYRAHITTDDKIVRIDDWPTLGKDVDEIIKRLKGRPGTDVKLYIWRRGMDPSLIDRPTEEMALVLRREQITIPPVQAEMLPGSIGLVELSTFSRVAAHELAKPIEEMLAQGMKGLVFDLRNNTGGLLDEAVAVAGLFLPQKTKVVSTEGRTGEGRSYPTRTKPILPPDMPVVVLVNRFTASASEIVSGALQDHDRAVLIGQRTYGKGSVQRLIKVPDQAEDEYEDENGNQRWDNWEPITKDWNGNGEFDFAPYMKLTIERYLLPTGRSIHREVDSEGNVLSPGGVEPDQEVPAERIAAWRLQEMLELRKSGKVNEWVRSAFDKDRALFERLALSDNKDPHAYPGFGEFYSGLETALSEEDVRFLVRIEARRLVQDVRGEAFPQGDYEDDLQLQAAIRTIFEKLGSKAEDVPEYARVFEEQPDVRPREGVEIASGESRDPASIEKALSLIAEARGEGGKISEKDLQELSDILSKLKKN